MQSTGLTNRNLIRLQLWIRSHTPLKSNTCPEITVVNEAGISVKVNVSYPGRSHNLRFFFLRYYASDGMRRVMRSQPRAY